VQPAQLAQPRFHLLATGCAVALPHFRLYFADFLFRRFAFRPAGRFRIAAGSSLICNGQPEREDQENEVSGEWFHDFRYALSTAANIAHASGARRRRIGPVTPVCLWSWRWHNTAEVSPLSLSVRYRMITAGEA
jgi:hypothetical protein